MTRPDTLERAVRAELTGWNPKAVQGLVNALQDEIAGVPDDRGEWPRAAVFGLAVADIRATFRNLETLQERGDERSV